jgi:hypothetical protein
MKKEPPAVTGAMSPDDVRDELLRCYDNLQRLQRDPEAFRRWEALDLLRIEAEMYLSGSRANNPPREIDRQADPLLYPLAELAAIWARGHIQRREAMRRDREQAQGAAE